MAQVITISIDLMMALCMFLFGRYFYKSKGKACNLLTGYNMRSENDRKSPDEEKDMCRVYGKILMIMAVPFLCGAAIDLVKPGIGCVLAWCIWILLFIWLCIKRTKLEK